VGGGDFVPDAGKLITAARSSGTQSAPRGLKSESSERGVIETSDHRTGVRVMPDDDAKSAATNICRWATWGTGSRKGMRGPSPMKHGRSEGHGQSREQNV